MVSRQSPHHQILKVAFCMSGAVTQHFFDVCLFACFVYCFVLFFFLFLFGGGGVLVFQCLSIAREWLECNLTANEEFAGFPGDLVT